MIIFFCLGYRFGYVNYEDFYYNVGLFVFIIYGNYDDFVGVVWVIVWRIVLIFVLFFYLFIYLGLLGNCVGGLIVLW